MARSLAVKVPTASLIALVEEKIAEIKTAVASYPADVETYKAEQKSFERKIVADVINALTNKPELIGDSHDSPIRVSHSNYGSASVSVSIDSNALGLPTPPVKPEDPNSKRYYGRDYDTPLAVLEKTLRVLKLTAQEEVSASTYSSVMDLL
jgi:hypothetical protein